jgi:hypothetical protein
MHEKFVLPLLLFFIIFHMLMFLVSYLMYFSRMFLCCLCNWPFGYCVGTFTITNWIEKKRLLQLKIIVYIEKAPRRWCLHLNVGMRTFSYANDPKSHTSSRVASGKAFPVGQVKGYASEKGHLQVWQWRGKSTTTLPWTSPITASRKHFTYWLSSEGKLEGLRYKDKSKLPYILLYYEITGQGNVDPTKLRSMDNISWRWKRPKS